MSEENEQEGQGVKKEFPAALKYVFIGLMVLVVTGLLSWSSLKFGVTPTFEVVGGFIVFTVVVFAVSQKFQDKVVFAKGLVIFIGGCLFVNLFYLGTLWTGEKVYNDNSMWSPAVFALLTVCIVVWFVHWFNGSPRKGTIAILTTFIGLMAYVLIAIGLGGDEGVRFAFIFVTAFEIVVLRLAVPSLIRVRYFRSSINTPIARHIIASTHWVILISLLVEAIVLPFVMVTQWPLSNWQVVVAGLSCPVAWYIVYAVWGKKYLK